MCASHTTSLGGSFSALSTSPDFSQSSPCGLACVGGVGIHFCGACVRSGFSFGVCSPAGFRFVCPFRLAVVVRLGWFGACVRSFSLRVFAVGWLLGFCVGCGWLFLVFLFVFFCWHDMLPHFLGCSALLAPALWLSLRWGLRVFAPPVLCVLPAWSLVGSACCCRRRGSFRRFLCFPALALAGLSFWLVLNCIDVRGPGSGMRDA